MKTECSRHLLLTYLQAISPRRGRPPRKTLSANYTTSGDDQTSTIAKESIKSEPVSTTSTNELISSLTRTHPLPDDGVHCDEISAEQTIVVGSGEQAGTLALGHLDASAGTVYLFHPMVDDAGQRIAFQTFKLYGQPEIETESTGLLMSANTSDVISGATDLANLLSSSMTATDISASQNNEPVEHVEHLVTQSNEILSDSLS